MRGGFSCDSSPVKAKDRLPDLPVSEQFRFSAGVGRDVTDNIRLGMSYTLLWMANNDIDNITLPGGVVLDGKYDPSFLHFVGLGDVLKTDVERLNFDGANLDEPHEGGLSRHSC